MRMLMPSQTKDVKKSVECLTVSVQEAADMIGVCRRTVENLTKDGVLPSIKIRRRVFYSVETIKKFIAGELNNNLNTKEVQI